MDMDHCLRSILRAKVIPQNLRGSDVPEPAPRRSQPIFLRKYVSRASLDAHHAGRLKPWVKACHSCDERYVNSPAPDRQSRFDRDLRLSAVYAPEVVHDHDLL
jgi:hypothetical protein